MKKRALFIFTAIFLVVFVFSIAFAKSETNKTITGKTITGKLPYTTTSILVNVTDTIHPAVFINYPKNKTHHNYRLINLSLYAYDTSFIEAAWYNIDNGANNSLSVSGTTLSYNTTFNKSEGSHVLNFYANDSTGNENSTSRYFEVNNTKLIIIYDEFADNENTTSFDNLTEQQLENVTFKLANAFGVINLTLPVNLTKYENTTTNEINLDEYVNLSYNRIFLNSSFLTDFSSIPSTLKLYSLNFTNPRILKDGAVCSAPTCVIQSYNFDSYSKKGNLIFNVTGFSVYSAEETPGETPAPPPSGGGGGGAATPQKIKKQIEFNQTSMKVSLKQGETKQVYLKIKNIGGSTLNVKISPSFEIKELVKFREDEFQLKANEEKEIEINAVTKEKTTPDVYIGKIIAESGAIKEEVMFAIEVESKGAIFDVALEIPEQFKEVLAGENIFAKINIYSLERVGLVDVNLSYEVRNSQGVVIAFEKEMFAIETQISFSREIKISKKAEPGEYVFYVKVEYVGKIGSASDSFKVIALEKPFFTSKRIIIFIVIITAIFIGIIIYELSIIRKLVKTYKEVNEIMLYKTKLIKKKRTR